MIFAFLQPGEVKHGTVPDDEDVTAFGGVAAEGVVAVALDEAQVVLFEAFDAVAEVEVAHGLSAQVQEVDVAGGVFGAFGIARIMDGGGVEVAVAGVNVEGFEGGKGGEGIVQGAGHEAGEGLVGGLDMEKAAVAGEGVKEAGGAGDGERGGGGFLEKGASAGLVFKNAGDVKNEPVGVGEFRAGALMGQPWKEGDERQEEGGGEGRKNGKGRHDRKTNFS